jgi:hypothetical protein
MCVNFSPLLLTLNKVQVICPCAHHEDIRTAAESVLTSGEEKSLLAISEVEPRFLDHQSRSLVTKLPCSGSLKLKIYFLSL